MHTQALLKYGTDHPGIAVAIIGALSAFLGYLLALARQVLQARAALAAERLKLRHEIASRWLRRFDEAAGRCWGAVRALQRGFPSPADVGGDALLTTVQAFDGISDEVYTIAAIVGLSFPEKGIGGDIMNAAIGFSDAANRVIANCTCIVKAEADRLRRGSNADDIDVRDGLGPTGDEGRTEVVALDGHVLNSVWAALVALCGTVNAAAERQLFEKRVSPTLRNVRRFLEQSRIGRGEKTAD